MTDTSIRIKGIAVELDGEIYIVPPLSLGALEKLQKDLSAFNGNISDPKQISTMVDATHAALRRNYPEITREKVADMLGLENMTDVFDAVMDVSGLKRKRLEAEAAGEATPGESST